jgi:hypothetical protein
MKPKVKDDLNVLQLMAMVNQLPWILQRIAIAEDAQFNKINGDLFEIKIDYKEEVI